MSNTLKLIERVRSLTDTGTDYAVAKMLGMQQSYLIEVKKGRRFPGQKAQLRLADLLKIDLRDVMALINEDKAKSEAERLHWRSLCSEGVRAALTATGTVAASLAATALIFIGGIPARANADVADHAIHYANRLRRWITSLRTRGDRRQLCIYA